MKDFFKKAFSDMKESAGAQHEVDKANLQAVKAESKAQWEEAKAAVSPGTHKKLMEEKRNEQIKEAHRRLLDAEKRIEKAKNK